MNKTTIAVQHALKELGKEHSEEAANKMIEKFEANRPKVYLLDELVVFVRWFVKYQDGLEVDFTKVRIGELEARVTRNTEWLGELEERIGALE